MPYTSVLFCFALFAISPVYIAQNSSQSPSRLLLFAYSPQSTIGITVAK